MRFVSISRRRGDDPRRGTGWAPFALAAALAVALASVAAIPAARASGAPASAPTLALPLDGTPSVFVDSGGQVTACGLRVFGVEPLPPPSAQHRTVDISILLGQETVTRGVGLVKASSMTASAAALQAGQPLRALRVTDGWLRVPGGARTAPRDGKPMADEADPNVLRYLADATTLFAVVDAALDGKPIEVSVVRAEQATHPVYRGTLVMEPQAQRGFVACVRALQARVTAAPR
ncbi:MAG: hypothetical protein U5L03_15950 [Burkholderiaceae bacterium]|nr:hypothetical protein [Burkholderiaceae bacterium]